MPESTNLDFSKHLSTVANLGVIVGIVFLIIEIQQANKIATATAEIEIRSLFAGVNEAAYAVPGMDKLLVKTQTRNETLTPEENVRFRGYVLRLTNTWLALEIAYSSDVLPDDTYTIIEDDIRNFIDRNPLSRPIFQEFLTAFPGQQSRQVFKILDQVVGNDQSGTREQ